MDPQISNTFTLLRIKGRLAACIKAQLLQVSLTYKTLKVLWWPSGKDLELWMRL
jgi:hypothetical protein